MRESLNLLSTGFTCLKLIYSSIALDGGTINEADGCSQWFLSLCSVVSGLEKPLLAGYLPVETEKQKICITKKVVFITNSLLNNL